MFLTFAWYPAHACVCLVLDYSVACSSVGLHDSPSCSNGEIFSADITSPGRPLLRSQSFHNTPGKWTPNSPSGPHMKRPAIVYCLGTEKDCFSLWAKNESKLPHKHTHTPPLLSTHSLYCSEFCMAPFAIPTPQSFHLCLPRSRASWVVTSPEERFLAECCRCEGSRAAVVSNTCLPTNSNNNKTSSRICMNGGGFKAYLKS